MRNELLHEPIEVGCGNGAPFGRKPALDQLAGTAADHVAGILIG